MRNIIVLPYASDTEIRRFLKIGYFLRRRDKNRCHFEFLLVNKNTVKPDKELAAVLNDLAPVRCYEPETVLNSYPEGPDEVFWKAMEYVSKVYEKDGGFALWLESDMLPKVPDWVDRLEREWKAYPGILIMGLYFSQKYLIKTGDRIAEHINGGACYSKDIFMAVPSLYKGKYFDVSLFPFIKKTKKFHASWLFRYSHMHSLLDDIQDNRAVILHGYRQDKEKFISKAIEIIESPEALEFEKNHLPTLPKKDRLCCDLAIFFGFVMDCPIHEKNTLLTSLKNNFLNLLYDLRIFYYYKKMRSCFSRIFRPGD